MRRDAEDPRREELIAVESEAGQRFVTPSMAAISPSGRLDWRVDDVSMTVLWDCRGETTQEENRMNRTLYRALIGTVTVVSLVAVAACAEEDDEPIATDGPQTEAPGATDAPPVSDVPVATEAPAETDPPPTDAPVESDPPPATAAPLVTDPPPATDGPAPAEFEGQIALTTFEAQQFHDTPNLSPVLRNANALSAILMRIIDDELIDRFVDVHATTIVDANDNGVLDDGDEIGLEPQPFVDGSVEIGINEGGNHFIVFVRPGSEFDLPPGTPASPISDGTAALWVFAPSQQDPVVVATRVVDDPTPGYYNVDFADPLMPPRP